MRKIPDEQEVQYLVAKLFLIHHFFYPQEQIAILLVKRHAADIAEFWNRHGWPMFPSPKEPETAQSSDADLFSRLALDFIFLISRCDNGRGGTLPDLGDLRRAIERVLPTVCVALCGTVQDLILNEEPYLMVTAPKGMRLGDGVRLPAFRYDTLKKLAEDTVDATAMAQYIIANLSPEDKPVTTGNMRGPYKKPYALVDISRGTISREEDKSTWIAQYVRSRCSLAFIAKKAHASRRPR